MVRLPGLALGGLFALHAAPAAAAPFPVHPRTPVIWDESECLTVVDRTVDPTIALTYTIPYEDPIPFGALEMEVADGRRHQFFAFCRDIDPLPRIPAWISEADVTAAAELGLVDADALDAGDILANNTFWDGCWTRITPDDARRPITFAAAEEPVLWDTSGLAIGPHVILGYTWDPPFNIWVKRPGVIQVVDDLDPAASPPAIAITSDEDAVYADETLPLHGCLRAMDGSTITAAWMGPAPDYVWHALVADIPVDGESFELPFTPPPEAVGHLIDLKVEIRDPLDRQFTAYLARPLALVPGSRPKPAVCTGPFCDLTGDDTTEPPDETADSSESGGSGTGGLSSEPGCACGVTPVTTLPPWLSLVLMPRRRAARPSGRAPPPRSRTPPAPPCTPPAA